MDGGGGGCSHIKPFWGSSWLSYRSTQFRHYVLQNGIKFHRLRAASCKTALHFGCQLLVRVVTCASDRPTDRQFLSPPPVLESSSQNSEKQFAYRTICFLSKKRTQEQPKARDAWARQGEGTQSFPAPPSQNLRIFTNLESLWTLSLWVVCGPQCIGMAE